MAQLPAKFARSSGGNLILPTRSRAYKALRSKTKQATGLTKVTSKTINVYASTKAGNAALKKIMKRQPVFFKNK